MRHLLIFFCILLFSLRGFTQNNLLFDKLAFDSSYQIIGLCPYEDDTKQYENLTFLITDANLLTKIKTTITYGQVIPKPAPYEENSLEIYVLKDKMIVETYSVSPKYNQVYFYLNDSTPIICQFDVQSILRYTNIRPINYTVKSLTIKSKNDFDNFINTNKKSKKFLCYENNTEDKEGKFDIIIKGDNDFKASKGSDIIKNELEKITTDKTDYIISYTPNHQDLSILTYTINTSKKIYDKLNLTKGSKGKWMPNEFEILAYWTK